MTLRDTTNCRRILPPRFASPQWLALLAMGLLATGGQWRGVAQEPVSRVVLTNAQQMAALGTNFPAGRYKARFAAVVTYISLPSRRLYVQDGDLGVQVNLTNPVASYRIGHRVEVAGNVTGGDPYLHLTGAGASVIGEAPLPVPKPVSIHRLIKGEDAYRYVTVRGMVRDMYSSSAQLVLLLTHDNFPFEVWIQATNAPLPRHWTDAEIEVTGHCYPFYSAATGRPSGVRFHATSTNDVRVLTPGIADRFDGRPLLTIAEVAAKPPDLRPRYRVAGTVTAHRPGTAYYIEDETGVMHVDQGLRPMNAPFRSQHLEHEPQTQFQPGDRVEVIGTRFNFFALAPSLQTTTFRRIGRVEPPKPIEVPAKDLFDGRYAGRLVTTRAWLIDQRVWGGATMRQNIALVLRSENDVFQAIYEGTTPAKWELPSGGYVRVTGVNDAEGSPSRKRATFKLLLREPADVVAVPPPPVWARSEFQRIAAVAGGVALLAGIWILAQRWQMRRLERRVAERTGELAAANVHLKKAERELVNALAHERELSELKSRFVSMVSHEYRTPLGIIMASSEILEAYLDRLPPEELRSNLRDITNASQHMSRMMEEVLLLGRVEAGRMTCKPRLLDLKQFCERLMDEIRSATGNRCPIELRSEAVLREAFADESLLRHILTNLLNNGVKYSSPGSLVELELGAEGHHATFTVRDRGIGIPEVDARLLFTAFHRGSNVGEAPGTGLGMTIVKRCVELHGGRITFESREGSGSTFTVGLPVFMPADSIPTEREIS